MNRLPSTTRAVAGLTARLTVSALMVISHGCCPSLLAAQVVDTATLVARVGSIEGSGPAVFSGIEALELDAAAGFFVLDGPSYEVRAFDMSGAHRWSFGRQGEGPGEFEYPVGLAFSDQGALWVIDPELQRATVLDGSGTLVETHHVPGGITLSPWPGRFDRNGRLYSYTESGTSEYGLDMVRYGPDLVAEATLSPPTPPEAEEFFEGRTPRGSQMRARVPFTPRLLWRLDSAGRFVWVWTAVPRIMRSEGGRRSEELGRFDVDAQPVTRDARAAALESLSRFEELGGRVDRGRIPDTRPVIRTFVLDDRDRVWVVPSVGSGEEGTTILLVGASGESRAVKLPFHLASFPTPIIRGSLLIGVERDDFGVEYVMLARLPR
jgi:hypothetical protein